jgi:hypothetical protein
MDMELREKRENGPQEPNNLPSLARPSRLKLKQTLAQFYMEIR